MTNQITVDKLLEMRLSAMSNAFLIQLNDPQMQEVPFEDRFGMLVDAEYTNRKNNSLKRLIKGSAFDQPEAHIAAIDYTSGRKLNRALIERLATCEYIAEHRNIFITGATGSGKTYMACALGMEACKQRFKTKYIRLPDLLLDLEIGRTENNYRKVLMKYSNPRLLCGLRMWCLSALILSSNRACQSYKIEISFNITLQFSAFSPTVCTHWANPLRNPPFSAPSFAYRAFNSTFQSHNDIFF